MVTYKLHVGDKEIDFKELGLKNSNDLKSIDLYTTRFRSGKDFYEYLKKISLITGTEKKDMFIQYTYKYLRNTDILYRENTILFSPNNLEETYYKVQDAIYSFFENKEFLRELYFFCKDRKDPNAFILANYINGSDVEFGEKNQFVSDLCESNMIKYSNGNRNYDYKTTRDLALLIYKFSYSKKATIHNNIEEKSLFTPIEGEQMSFFRK